MYDPIAKKMPDIFPLDEVSVDDEEEARVDKPIVAAVGTGTKVKTKATRDDRRARRYNVPKDRQRCELKAKGSVWPAFLVNESASGCAVLIDRVDGLHIGEKVELHTDQGWLKFRVVYIKAATAPESSGTKSDKWFRLGLKKASGLFPF